MQFSKDRLKHKWNRIKKTQFIVILLICSGILAFQVAQCVKKYYLMATATGDKYVHVSKTSFPVMTICSTYPYKLDRLNYHGVATKTDIQFKAQFVSNRSGVTPVEFYNDVVWTQEEIIESVEIFGEKEIGGKNNFLVKPNETFCGEYLFKKKQYYYFGDCFALNLPECLLDGGVVEINIIFPNSTDVFIHHHGQFSSPNSRSRVDVDIGSFVKIGINHEVVQMLSDKGECVEHYGLDEGVDGDMEDSFDGCMYSKLRRIMLDELNCTVPWMPDQTRICTEPEDRKRAFELYQKNRRNQKDICPNSCKFTNMYFGPPVTGLRNQEDSHTSAAILYFRRDIKTTNEYYLYSVLSMLAEIGGYVGLLLGVSLFKLADINNLVLDWVLENRIIDTRVEDIIGVEEASNDKF